MCPEEPRGGADVLQEIVRYRNRIAQVQREIEQLNQSISEWQKGGPTKKKDLFTARTDLQQEVQVLTLALRKFMADGILLRQSKGKRATVCCSLKLPNFLATHCACCLPALSHGECL